MKGFATAIIVLLIHLSAAAQTVTVEDVEVPYVLKDGRMLVKQMDLAPALPDLEPGKETYDLLDILERHPDLRGTSRDGILVRVRYYPLEEAEAYQPDPEQRTTPHYETVRKRRPAVKADWRNESTFAEGEYRSTVDAGGGRITDARGRIVSSTAEDRRQGKFANQREYHMQTHQTGRHVRPDVIYINGWYQDNHYYVPGQDETSGPSRERAAQETSSQVLVTPVAPVVEKEGEDSGRYYVPVEELEDSVIRL